MWFMILPARNNHFGYFDLVVFFFSFFLYMRLYFVHVCLQNYTYT